jgi:hypothetical protein
MYARARCGQRVNVCIKRGELTSFFFSSFYIGMMHPCFMRAEKQSAAHRERAVKAYASRTANRASKSQPRLQSRRWRICRARLRN